MIVQSEFPHLRSYSQTQLNIINQALSSSFDNGLYCHLSVRGLQNVRRVRALMASLGLFVSNGLYGSSCLPIARFDPLFSLESMLSPSNLDPMCFSYISDMIPGGGEEEAVISSVKCYFSLCHMNGTLICFSWSDLRDLLSKAGFKEEQLEPMLRAMNFWLTRILKRSERDLNRHDMFIDDCILSECAVMASLAMCFYVMAPLRLRLMDLPSTIVAMRSCIELLWDKCARVWLQNCGPQVCLVKTLSLLSVIRAAVISNGSLSLEAIEQYSSISNNILGCFKARCMGCHIGRSPDYESSGIVSCEKEIICCTSSSDLMCDMMFKILDGDNPFDTSKDTINALTEVDSFTSLNTTNKKMLRLLLLSGANILKQVGPCKLSTLALRRLNVSDYASISHAVNLESMMRGRTVSLGELVYVSLGQRALDWGESSINVKANILKKWCECIAMGCDDLRLDCDRLMDFVYFVKECCSSSSHSDCMAFLMPRLQKYINDYYSKPVTDRRSFPVSDIVSAFVCCVVMLELPCFISLKGWMNRSINGVEDGPRAKRPRLKPRSNPKSTLYFPEFFVGGRLILPNEIEG